MAPLRFHERHFPTFLRLPQIVSRPVHWTAHAGMLAFVVTILALLALQTVQLATLRRAVAEREAKVLLSVPFGSVAEPSLLGQIVVCDPGFLRWYYGTAPLCDAGLGQNKAE